MIGARLVLPWGSAVELILMWSSQQDSLSQAAGVHVERPGASISICFLSSLDWPLLTKGAGQSVRGAGGCQGWPGPKESGATMPSIPCLPFHSRVISHPGCLLGRQCIMEGACFTFASDELLTRAKNQSAPHTHTHNRLGICAGRCSTSWGMPSTDGLNSQASAVFFRCADLSRHRRHRETSLASHAASMARCWQQQARFSLGSPHMTGTLAHTSQRQVRFLPCQESASWARENKHEDALRLPWVYCYGPQLETCRAWAAESVPICQNLSCCRGGRICPIHLWAEAK